MFTWEEALKDFLLGLRATKESNTERFYKVRLTLLAEWACDRRIGLCAFTRKHLRAYLAARADSGVSEGTLRHDGRSAKVFFRFAKQEGYIEIDPLVEFKPLKASEPFVKMPPDDEVFQLLSCVHKRWDSRTNPKARFVNVRERRFLKARDYAILAGLVATECRIGELLNALLEDYDRERMQLCIRQAKGDAPRVIPFTEFWRDAVDAWIKARRHLDDCPYLFRTEQGTQIEYNNFRHSFNKYMAFAGLSGFTLHGLRHYAITKMARQNLVTAMHVAGHKNPATTMKYLHRDPEAIREDIEEADLLGNLLGKVQKGPREKRGKRI